MLGGGALGANRLPTGTLTLSDLTGAIATPVAGDVLSFNSAGTANFGITDTDGIVGPFHLQWQAEDVAHPGYFNLGNGNGTTYTVNNLLVGDTIRVVASYTDGRGNHEQVISDVSAIVGANTIVNHAPIILQQTNPVGLQDTAVLEDRALGGPAIAGGPAGSAPASSCRSTRCSRTTSRR